MDLRLLVDERLVAVRGISSCVYIAAIEVSCREVFTYLGKPHYINVSRAKTPIIYQKSSRRTASEPIGETNRHTISFH